MRKLVILSLLNQENSQIFKMLNIVWQKYFNVEQILDEPKNISLYLNRKIDILFIDDANYFQLKFYDRFLSKNKLFKNVVISSKPSIQDIYDYKMRTDIKIFTGFGFEYSVWSTIAVLRLYWSFSSNDSTIIYKDIIADFVDNKFFINKKMIELTPMERKVLRYFMTRINKIVTKEEIMQKVWGHTDSFTILSFNQIFFKLKLKIGKHYFTNKRGKGIIFK